MGPRRVQCLLARNPHRDTASSLSEHRFRGGRAPHGALLHYGWAQSSLFVVLCVWGWVPLGALLERGPPQGTDFFFLGTVWSGVRSHVGPDWNQLTGLCFAFIRTFNSRFLGGKRAALPSFVWSAFGPMMTQMLRHEVSSREASSDHGTACLAILLHLLPALSRPPTRTPATPTPPPHSCWTSATTSSVPSPSRSPTSISCASVHWASTSLLRCHHLLPNCLI